MKGEKGEKKKKPRRADNEGGLSQRSDGRWQGTYYITLPNGRRKRCYVYHAKRNECARLLREAKAKAEQGELEKTNKTVGVWLVEWLEMTKKKNYSPTSYQNRFYVIHNRLVKVFEGIPLDALDASKVEEWVAFMVAEGLSPNTIHNYYSVLKAALRNAVKKRLIPFNPCEAVELPHIPKADAETLNLEQFHQLLDVMGNHWLKPIVVTLLGTGMRLGEVLSLKWTQVSFVDNVIFVLANVAYISRGPQTGFVAGPPKTESSKRVIAMAPFVHDTLKAHRIAQWEKQSEEAVSWQDHDLVFPNERGGFLREQRVEANVRSAMIRAGLSPAITPHKLRHSCATILYEMGIDPAIIQQILGHSTIGVTMDKYVHLTSDAQVGAMAQLNAGFEREKKREVN